MPSTFQAAAQTLSRFGARCLLALALFLALGALTGQPENPLLPGALAADTLEEHATPGEQLQSEGDPATETAGAEDADAAEPESGRDQLPAPKLKRGDYPKMGFSSRSAVWIIAQMHLFFAAFVLAVPMFVLVIEWMGVKTRDERYDDMAHEFMKISMTAYSITALFGGALAFALFLLYPQFMEYMMRVFGKQTLVYA
ncbi:MAG: cytochrome ubiquinol oxidase subunit I, partial [Pseudomonadota bacterium]|nr:cytochrome ubiquinol oxidase subunit I [Pseudomonadota bacterium]